MNSPAPNTLGYHRAMCVALAGGENNRAVQFLDQKIAESPGGVDEPVIIDEGQVVALLVPMLLMPVEVTGG